MRYLSKTTWMGVLVSLCLAVSTAQAVPTFVGSWHVGDGPVWTSNPDVLSARETAALLFGGSPVDYAISTVSSNPSDINFMAFVDGWGDSTFLFTPVSQDYKLDTGAPGYNNPFGGPAYSAYVLDHSCFYRYGNPSLSCEPSEPGLNYAFRTAAAVPEPSTWLLLATGGAGMLGYGWRRRQQAVEQ